MKTDTLFLTRFERCEDDATLGELLIPEERLDGKFILRKLATIERRWLNNKACESCIPDGVYPLQRIYHGRFYRRYKEKFGHKAIWEIVNVVGRSAILIHVANFERDLKGCVGVGYPARGRGTAEKMIFDSVPGYKVFYELMDKLSQKQAGLKLKVSTLGDRPCNIE